ncbi:MAG: MotA/TolQ/ExbB proton channel family protein [Myxococcales bacterium]|nr:MotA/TolQ/ExbB proton channel family protein [Myxococcales bacterium]
MRQLVMLAAEGGKGGANLVDAIKHNPTFLILNLVVSAVVVTIIVERAAFQIRRYSVNSKEFFGQVKKLVVAGNIDRAIKLCEASDYPVLQLVKSGLTHANKGADEIDAALSEKLAEIKPQVEKRIGALWSLANIATLVGLVGTVFGLISTFGAIAAEGLSPAVKQQMLSNGIAEAMYNTAFGLLIAVICMIAHVILHTRAKGIAHELDSITERVFNLLTISTKGSY